MPGERLLVCMATRSAIIFRQEWEQIGCTTDNHIPLVVPGVPEADHGKQTSQKGFNHSRKDLQEDRQVRRMCLQLTWKYHRQRLLPRVLQRNQLRTEQAESRIMHSLFRKTRIAKCADARKLREMQKKSRRSGGLNLNCSKMWRCGNSGQQGSQCRS